MVRCHLGHLHHLDLDPAYDNAQTSIVVVGVVGGRVGGREGRAGREGDGVSWKYYASVSSENILIKIS